LGVLEALVKPCDVERLAQPFGADPKVLRQTLDFLARSTELVECAGAGRYRLTRIPFAEIVFQFEKFIGAYGACIRGLSMVPLGADSKQRVDQNALASAFEAVANIPSPVSERLKKHGCRYLLDLGCGSGALLVDMALADDGFKGIGLDTSPAMCRLARSRLSSVGVVQRVHIHRADARDVSDLLDSRERRRVEIVHGRSLMNAFFGNGTIDAVKFLRKLRRSFPGRMALFVDYYGELGRRLATREDTRLGRLQDLAQIASGQGVPPANRAVWRSVYENAGCELISANDFQGEGIRWFIHEVQL